MLIHPKLLNQQFPERGEYSDECCTIAKPTVVHIEKALDNSFKIQVFNG